MTVYEARVLEIGGERFIAVLSHDESFDYFEKKWKAIWVNWNLYSVANVDGPPEVFVGDDGPTWDFEQASLRASGFVKWDGCHEFVVEDYHGCSPQDLNRFLVTIAIASRAAAELLTRSEHDWNTP